MELRLRGKYLFQS